MTPRTAILTTAALCLLNAGTALLGQTSAVISSSSDPVIQAGGSGVMEVCSTAALDFFTEEDYQLTADCTFYTPQGGVSSAECSSVQGETGTAACMQTFGFLPGGDYQTTGTHYVDFDYDTIDCNVYPFLGEPFYDPLGYINPSTSCLFSSCTSVPQQNPTDPFYYCSGGADVGLATSVSEQIQTIDISPLNAQVGASETLPLTTNKSPVTWSVIGGGTIDQTGLYHAPLTVPVPTDVTVTVYENANPNDTTSTLISLTALAITINPAAITLNQGQAQQFSATVTGNNNTAVSWSLQAGGPSGSKIDAGTGLYTAPPTVTGQETDTVVATSKADTSQSATAQVTLEPETITIQVAGPNPFTATPGLQVQLSALVNVNGASNSPASLSWTPSTVSPIPPTNAIYTVPSMPITTMTQVQVTVMDPVTKVSGSIVLIENPPPTPVTITQVGAMAAGQTTAVTITGTGFGSSPSVSLSNPVPGLAPPTLQIVSATNTLISGNVTFPVYPQAEVVTVTVTAGGARSNAFNANVTPVTITPAVIPTAASLDETQGEQFSASFACKTQNGSACSVDQTGTWSITSAPALGTLSATGLYTNTATGYTTNQIVTAKVCANVNLAVCQGFQVTLVPIAVSVNPVSSSLAAGKTQLFAASVTGVTGAAGTGNVKWSISPQVGSLTNPGPSTSTIYQAPSSVTAAQTITISACSVVDGSRCNTSSTVNLQPTPDFTVTLSPTSVTVPTGGTSSPITVTVTPVAGFTGTVNLALSSGLPAGAKATFSPVAVSITGTGAVSSSLTLVLAATPAGTDVLGVSGSSGALNHSASLTLNVLAPSISVSAGGVTVPKGSTFTFPNTTTNTAVSVLFTITNSGSASLNLTNPTSLVTGPFAEIASPTTPVAANGGTTTFRIRLDLPTAGTYSATVAISSDDPVTPTYSFTLQGTVTPGAAPVISVQAGSTQVAKGSTYVFPNTTTNTPVSVLFTITNSGTASLNISNPSSLVTGPFAEIGAPTTPVAANGGTTTFRIRLDLPTAGTYTSTVSISSDDPVNPTYSFTIQGTVTPGAAPVISVQAGSTQVAKGSTYIFPSTQVNTPVSVLFTITNSGTAILNISNPSSLVTGPFAEIGAPTTPVAANGGTTTFRIRLELPTAGTYTSTVSISTDDPVNPTYSFMVQGTVTP
jgi:hypothetical protein